MKSKVYSIFDSKTACFSKPWCHISDASAIREFSDAVNDNRNPNNQYFNHPEDFSLFFVGEFDDLVGHMESSNPISLVTAASVKEPDDASVNGFKRDLFDKAPVH